VLLLTFAIATVFAASASSVVITMRSGGGYAACANDPAWTYLAGPPVTPLSALPFTAADFAAALSGPPSVVVPPYGSFWLPALQCDPQAQWISVDCNRGPASTLFAQAFRVDPCCITRATLTFCWASDDYLGDPPGGGPNPDGVYLNQIPLPINGGSYATESSVTLDVTHLVHCGNNTIHVYDRDGAAVVSGAMFSVTLDILECPVKTAPSTWGSIKALYR
jgi:hypothetical protein